MLLNGGSTIVIQSQAILIKFAIIHFFLIILVMIPAWVTILRIEEEMQSYFAAIFYSLEKHSSSIEELKKVIVTYNKVKFIENNQDTDKNSFVYLVQNEEMQNQKALKIALLRGELQSQIEVSKVTDLNPELTIVLSTTSEAVIDNILPKHFNLFYNLTLKNYPNPLSMVRPKSILIILLSLFSMLLTWLYVSIQSYLFYKREANDKALELKKEQRLKTACLNFMKTTLSGIYEDLNYLFLTTNFEKEQKPFLESKILETRELLGRMITFGTLKRDYCEVELTHELNSTIDCFLDKIFNKKIRIIKNNFCNKIFVQQTKSKNLLILLSILHHFIINMPPKGELTITIEAEIALSAKVIFSDNVPIPWKIFEHEKGNSLDANMYLTFDKLMFACADEEIIAEHGNNTFGNYFILEYKLNRNQNNFNVIKGKFR